MAAASLLICVGITCIYYLNSQSKESIDFDQMVYAENGIRSITLADSSQVVLSKGSQLRWSKDKFNQKERRVQLLGEAYFTVSHDSSRPFVVETEDIWTKVLGTKFNVESYPIENHIKVSLVEGSVEVGSKLKKQQTNVLKPGQMLDYSKRKNSVVLKQITSIDPSYWTQGGLVFNEIPLSSALQRLSKHYDLNIQFNNEKVRGKTVTATFDQISWQEALEALLFPYDLTYSLSQDTVDIY